MIAPPAASLEAFEVNSRNEQPWISGAAEQGIRRPSMEKCIVGKDGLSVRFGTYTPARMPAPGDWPFR